jgi:hypothetical protein
VLNEPKNVLGAITEVHYVPYVFDIDIAAELAHEPIADYF